MGSSIVPPQTQTLSWVIIDGERCRTRRQLDPPSISCRERCATPGCSGSCEFAVEELLDPFDSREQFCLNTRLRKRTRGAVSACHLQPYTLSDPGGKYLRTGTRPSTVRQLHTSIGAPMKGDVCRSRRNVLCSPAIWNSRTYPRCGWRDVAAIKVRDVE